MHLLSCERHEKWKLLTQNMHLKYTLDDVTIFSTTKYRASTTNSEKIQQVRLKKLYKMLDLCDRLY